MGSLLTRSLVSAAAGAAFAAAPAFAEGDRPEPAKADIFPAYDDDGGLLLVLTPR